MNKQTTPSHASTAPVWFITGCSTGFGMELARQTMPAVRASSGKQPGEAVARGADFTQVMS